MTKPVSNESATVNASTGKEIAVALPVSIGRKFAASLGTSGTSCQASSAPGLLKRLASGRLMLLWNRPLRVQWAAAIGLGAATRILGAESWQAADGDRRNATYFWSDLETLKLFSNHPAHQEAKRQYARWYSGYHIVISEVLRSYGNGTLEHFTPNERS